MGNPFTSTSANSEDPDGILFYYQHFDSCLNRCTNADLIIPLSCRIKQTMRINKLLPSFLMSLLLIIASLIVKNSLVGQNTSLDWCSLVTTEQCQPKPKVATLFICVRVMYKRALRCVLEQDTLSSAEYWLNPRRQITVLT